MCKEDLNAAALVPDIETLVGICLERYHLGRRQLRHCILLVFFERDLIKLNIQKLVVLDHFVVSFLNTQLAEQDRGPSSGIGLLCEHYVDKEVARPTFEFSVDEFGSHGIARRHLGSHHSLIWLVR